MNKTENQLNNLIIEQKSVVDKSGVELLEIMPFARNNRINNNSGGIPVKCVRLDEYFEIRKYHL